MMLSIDLTEVITGPLGPKSLCSEFKIVGQEIIKDAVPWIVVTLFDTGPNLTSSH
jgi:hypothetical protein